MIDKELLEQFETILSAIDASEQRLRAEMLMKEDIEPISDRSANKAVALMEGTLGKRIDSLFDGYKLTHEKQWELERRMERLEHLIDDLQNRIA